MSLRFAALLATSMDLLLLLLPFYHFAGDFSLDESVVTGMLEAITNLLNYVRTLDIYFYDLIRE